MHPTISPPFPALIFLEISRVPVSMCSAGVLLFVIALWVAKADVAHARGLDKVVALNNLCFAIPLAVFGALHLTAAQSLMTMVPSYMPWHLFWAYFFGVAMLAASLSMATKIQVRWSGLLFGIAMFLFVAMMDFPGVLSDLHNRIAWELMFRELSFGAGAWMLAAATMTGSEQQSKRKAFAALGCVIIGITTVLYGVENFLHPINVPAVPLEMVMPTWIPARPLIGYLTAVFLVIAGVGILSMKKARMAATYLGTWIVLLVLFVYGPILISALSNPSTGVKVEGINYFADTLLFAGTVLALASAIPRND